MFTRSKLVLAVVLNAAVALVADPAAQSAEQTTSITEAQFREYIECFNRRDYACFGKYYADDVVLSKGPKWPALQGREAIFDFYRDVDAHGLKEHMQIHGMVIDGDTIRADLEASFEAARDWPDFGSRVVRAGDRWQLRGTLQYRIVAGRFAQIAPVPRPATPVAREVDAQCTRDCLDGFIDRYLAALTARDPSRLRLASTVRYTENGATILPGEGLWKTAASLTDYRIRVADPHTGQAGFIGTIVQTDGKLLMLALRLKVEGGTIREIETVSGAPFVLPGAPLMAVPRPSLSVTVPSTERLTRDAMIAVANRNFDGIVAADGSHFAPDCQRVENRMAMSGNPQLDYPIATLPGRKKPRFAAMGCQQQVESHLFDTLDSVDSRRFLVLDEERQLVFGFFMLNWYRDNRCNEVRDYGRVCRPEGQQPTGLRVGEILNVAGGKVHDVEVVFSYAPYQAPSGWEDIEACTRDCLTGLVEGYLGALAARDPRHLPLAPDVRYTENGTAVPVGEGLWRTVTGIGSYRIHVADPESGQAGFVGELREGDASTMFGLRLKVKQRRITEVETVIGRSFRPKHPSMVIAPRPSLARAVPVAERQSREQMLATVNANFEGVLASDGRIFAPDCQRIENRMPMSGNPALSYPINPLPDKPMPHFGSMGCREQIEANLFDTLDAVEPRRSLVVDEERQLVFGVYMLRFYGRTTCNDIPGYGRTCPKAPQQPIALRSAEVLGVRGGRIHEVEVVFTRAAYDAVTGWEP